MRLHIEPMDAVKTVLVGELMNEFGGGVLPGWVAEVFVEYTEGLDDYAQVSCEYSYRRISVDLGPRFFTLQDDQRGRTLVHELAHALQAPLTDFIETMLLTAKIKANKPVMELYTKALESANDDTAEMLWRLMKK